MLDGCDEIIFANCFDKKSLKCEINNDIPIKHSDYSYVPVNGTILCNCELEVEESFLLDSLAAGSDKPDQFQMYSTINLAFINYVNSWMDSNLPIIYIIMTGQEQKLPLTLQDLKPNDSILMNRPIHSTLPIKKKICGDIPFH